MRMLRLPLLAVGSVVLFAGCGATRQAPVIDRLPPAQSTKPAAPSLAKPAPRALDPRPGFYVVRRGDTLYSIALDHGLDYRELADWNGIDPTRIVVGQQLRLTPPPGAVTATPLRGAPQAVEARPLDDSVVTGSDTVKSQPQGVRVPYSDQVYAQMASIKPVPETATKPQATRDDDSPDWIWPAAGKVVSGFTDNGTLKGIAIAGKLGQPVVASAAGRVIFSGTGIRGLGKFVIIKHNDAFISVYAHNSEILVKYGQNVARGQKIAEMGNSDADAVKLHFEIRRFGKPVDPVKLLPDRQA
ncbi:MAG: peptidoglycan DD-metalloendopeptidase family protein [Betaproteobacteria bacterium]|nr:peptidoglycan DD-metalloendopeptidase family protein [Betaproteobacteria bacterium]